MVEILWFSFGGVMLGFATSTLTSMIDFAMDYGHLLDSIRYNKAKRICDEIQMPMLFKKFADELQKKTDFGERLEYADEFYWKLAAIQGSFTPWICKICMGGRINFVLAMTLSLIGIFLGENAIGIMNMFSISILANYFFLKKVI